MVHSICSQILYRIREQELPVIMAKNHESRPDNIVAKDLGIQTFMITNDTNGFCTE